ncbi:MAG: AraC family transcriptional regulator [Candidatus Aquilonibacter sp.]
MFTAPIFPIHQDALSQVLDLLRLRGTCVQSGSTGKQKARFKGDGPCIYIVRRGALQISVSGSKMEHLSAGDVLLSLGGGSDAISGSDADYLRGEFEFDSIVAERILSVLPKAITLRPIDGKPFPWVDVCCAFMLEEAMNGLAGAASMISRLLDLLFVRTLRTWASEGAPTRGWLAGAVDERIGKVLAAMHENFAVDWTLAKLAETAPMSRTALANRFQSLVGTTPMAYLNAWRLDRATELLRNPGISIAEIATRVGYGSNPAFSRAFALRYGSSPSHWRKSNSFT